SVSTGNTYTPITGGTVFTSGSYDNTMSGALSMGGTFNYGGVAFTTCYISTNGFIKFGTGLSTTTYTPLSSSGSSGVIAAFAQDAGGSTASGAAPEIRYENTGSQF